MGLFSWIIVGLVAGIIAKLLMPGNDPGGCIVTMLLGVAGGLVGGFLGSQLGLGRVDGFDIRSLALAVGGSLLLLLFFRFMQKPKSV
ncbi:MAG: GlsB/YeaQ/YmgE family stress response membrane protein [Pirellulaceae bacterium]|jgi:uncharacterized membrane protein YeaQ/YmgE (transglycosylase-associated protein family)|nr:GlsB/YeaQ/YmgE family stress response membrane protein [Pirellulaceae bacterium]